MDSGAALQRQTRDASGFLWKPVLALLVLAPAMAELLTSSTPPAVYFIPWVFAVFTILYGGSAVLIREWAIRARAGWPAILLLGAAYGILEEGLSAHSFFDPHWRAIGRLGSHGRAAGVNWIWAIDLTVFHSVFSIGLTILGVYVLFPRTQLRPWVPSTGLVGLSIIVALDFLLMIGKGSTYPISRAVWCATFLSAVGLVFAAWKLPRVVHRASPRSHAPRTSWRWLALFAFITSGCYIALVYFVPAFSPSAWLTLGLTLTLFAGAASLLIRWIRIQGPLTRFQQFGLFSGVAVFFALIAPLQDFNPGRPDPAHGMTLVGLMFSILIVALYRRTMQTEEQL
jgi:hypothetical protein